MTKTSYQMLGILSFSNRERALPPSTRISEQTTNFCGKKKKNNNNEVFRGCKGVMTYKRVKSSESWTWTSNPHQPEIKDERQHVPIFSSFG